ncbi:MAG: nuclease-related domain-containing protein [Xanthomonadales bacterium]|nr:nuclease-related domain-containing protein [Xanthomonadales bacterium]
MLHLAWIVPLLLLIFFLASPRYRGDIAESRVRRILAQGLENSRYTILNDVLIPSGGGTIHIDHVVVSKFGIFVIESHHARGWVSGSEVQDRWKQQNFGRITRFDNPLYRNRLQAQALQSLLQFPGQVFHRVLVMVGQSGFKNAPPPNVVTAEKLIRHMRRQGQHLLTGEQADRALKEIDTARIGSRPARGNTRIMLFRLALVLAFAAGVYVAFGDAFHRLHQAWSMRSEMHSAPGDFHPDGRRKTEQELWEDALRCAYSSDAERCVCFEPEGARAEIGFEQCRELAERGSVLRQ